MMKIRMPVVKELDIYLPMSKDRYYFGPITRLNLLSSCLIHRYHRRVMITLEDALNDSMSE